MVTNKIAGDKASVPLSCPPAHSFDGSGFFQKPRTQTLPGAATTAAAARNKRSPRSGQRQAFVCCRYYYGARSLIDAQRSGSERQACKDGAPPTPDER
ncbi:hypothetical protein MTO96_021970 [Rhipicephalus appendiculatus]